MKYISDKIRPKKDIPFSEYPFFINPPKKRGKESIYG